MKKIRLLLAIIAACIGAVLNVSARIAPTLPEAQTLESGKTYYIYNVMENKFLCRSTTSTSYAGLGIYGDKVIITATEEDNGYTIKWADNNYFLMAYDNYINSSSNPGSWRDYFIVSESSKGYTIQRSSKNTTYFKSDEFVGYNGSNGDRLTPALSEGSIHWVFYSADDAEHYIAKHKLFTNLEVADQYNFYITQYESIYDNPASTTEELNMAQSTLSDALNMSGNYVSPSWTEYPILFQNNTDNKWELSYNKSQLEWNFYKNNSSALEKTSVLTATVNVDNDATLVYKYGGSEYSTMHVYVDGNLVQAISSNQSQNLRRYYIELAPGKHDIVWECIYKNASTYTGTYYSHTLSEIGIQNTPTITPATTTVEGQLGTEVLKLVDPVSSVKKIVIRGIIGSDDWTTIGLMVNAFSIDMSGATATAPMPAEIFRGNKFPFLHDVTLPQGLTEIGERAFYESDVENEMTFPESMRTIGRYAFSNAKIKAAYMNDEITSIGNDAFNGCKYLENATYPSKAINISGGCFYGCNALRTFTIPEGISSIGGYAFYECWEFNPRFPTTMESIEIYAFRNTATDSLFVTENMSVTFRAFDECRNLVYAEWPTSYFYAYYNSSYGASPVVSNCPKLNKVKLMSPTVVAYNQQSFFSGNTLGNITLQVPDFLVSAYKLDPYWYQCNVEGFNSAELADWNIRKPLVLNPGQRMNGTPNLNVRSEGNITINGDDVQEIKDLSIDFSPVRFSNIDQQWGMMLGNNNNTNITGNLQEWVLTSEKTWYFITLPFDTKVGDIETHSYENGQATSYAIRYYDGASRAQDGTGNNWKNYSKDDIIPAGTGFIYQTAKAAYSKFVAQNNASKQNILSNREFVKSLAENPSDVTANKGWNLVGNPWQTYYNIHKVNFTAPITVWDMKDKKYVAYSIIDDDYAIKPLEAIFVQCPDELNEISFPIDGRQLTDVIESQNGARATDRNITQVGERKLIDVELSDGELTDKTRFVMNPAASMDYELSRDASKFLSMDASVPQIYTIENGEQLAINERPLDKGSVKLGLRLAKSGTFTISAPRNQFQNIVLVDNETGSETDLNDEGSYTFTADAGTNESRFALRIGSSVVTTVQPVTAKQQKAEPEYYNLNGQRVLNPRNGIYIVEGKKVVVE